MNVDLNCHLPRINIVKHYSVPFLMAIIDSFFSIGWPPMVIETMIAQAAFFFRPFLIIILGCSRHGVSSD